MTFRLLAACALSFALRAASFAIGPQLFHDDFRHGLAQWAAELEQPGQVVARRGILSIDVPAGCTLWFRPQLESPVMIQYEARMIQAGGPNDRVSDLNAFWMATDARSPDFFAVPRSGKFSAYDQLLTYYVGQGGNSNTTTRFRRYIGEPDNRPLRLENDRRDADLLLHPNVWQKLQLVAMGGRIQYYHDGRLIFDFTDSAPYTRGRYGFRTTRSHVELRHFAIYRLPPAVAASHR